MQMNFAEMKAAQDEMKADFAEMKDDLRDLKNRFIVAEHENAKMFGALFDGHTQNHDMLERIEARVNAQEETLNLRVFSSRP